MVASDGIVTVSLPLCAACGRGCPRSSRGPPRRLYPRACRKSRSDTSVRSCGPGSRSRRPRRSGSSSATKVRASGTLTSRASANASAQPFGEGELEESVGGAPDEQYGLGEVRRAGSRRRAGPALRICAMNRAASRRTPASVRAGVIQRRVSSGSSGSLTSGPKPSTECRSGRSRIGSISSLSRQALRPGRDEQPERCRRELVERVAVGEDEPTDALWRLRRSGTGTARRRCRCRPA